jgi:dTDP-4-amino-4,6-dideoxygalactose transaminase
MTPVTAAIGLGQLDELPLFLESRIFSSLRYMTAVEGCTWLIPQPSSQSGIDHTYYTFGVKFLGDQIKGITWDEFYDQFVELGGHGFYSNCKNPYLEPFFIGRKSKIQNFALGLCPVAEDLQTRIMAFKTNYIDRNVAIDQANKLASLIDKIGRN